MRVSAIEADGTHAKAASRSQARRDHGAVKSIAREVFHRSRTDRGVRVQGADLEVVPPYSDTERARHDVSV
jgi:hypothetical protein